MFKFCQNNVFTFFMKLFFKFLILFFVSISLGATNEIRVFDFTQSEFKTLDKRKVKGETIWTLGANENGNFIKAEANAAGSGLGKEIEIDLNKTPFLNISWKVEKDLTGIVENSKKGHDFAARVFVVKKTGKTILSNRALNYVFSSNNKVGDSWRSPYTKQSIDIVLSTTKNDLNSWVNVKANVKEDFKKFHDLDVDDLNAVAIMSDTDNSKKSVIAYYQNIYFSAN